ncbi:hypothetical protein CBL_20341 [Carabus blaptoides fortunei]
MATRGARILAMVFSNYNIDSTEESTGNTSGVSSELNIIEPEETDYFQDSESGQNAISTSAQNLNNIEEDDEPDEPFQDSGSSYKPTDSEDSDSGKNNILQPSERKNRGFASVTENPKKKRARKGHPEPNTWKRNINQTSRMKGQSYSVVKKTKDIAKNTVIQRKQRELGPRCNSSMCLKSKEKRQCYKISEEQRQAVFKLFWSDMNWNERKIFVATLVHRVNVKQRTTQKASSPKNYTLKYHLKIENELVPVCKKMFSSTLHLGEWTIANWVKKSTTGIMSSTSKFPNKVQALNVEKRLQVRYFLNKLPKMESHYCRASTSKLYLEPTITTYSDMYKIFTEEVGGSCASRDVFISEMQAMNIAMFQPRKDQCDLCFSHKQGNIETCDYETHIMDKDSVRVEKELDKENAIKVKVTVFTMDVQAAQLVPYLPAGMLYFKQKLPCHNFTIYNLATDKVVVLLYMARGGRRRR